MSTLTKAGLAKRIYEKIGLSKREAEDIVSLFFEEIHNALEHGSSVKLSGFGNFELRDKDARPGRNPKTGEVIPVPARRVVTFKPGQKLRESVEGYLGPEKLAALKEQEEQQGGGNN